MNMLKAVVGDKSMEDVWKDLSLSSSAKDGTVFQGMSLLLVNRDPHTTATTPFSLPLPLARSSSPPLDRSNNKRRRHEINEDCVRQKRMVKNRESAARSRARKQAYAYELELENAKLRKEIAMLRKQLQNKDLCLAKEAPAVELLEKPSLQRTLTAPF